MLANHLSQPTPTTPPAILCNSTQIQLLFYQFLQHVQINADNRCMQSLKDFWQERQDEAIHHQLKQCQQQVNNLTSAHFGVLSHMHKQSEHLQNVHELKISKCMDQTSSLDTALQQCNMKLQELNNHSFPEKHCSKESEANLKKQNSSEVVCEELADGDTSEKLNKGLVYATSAGNLSLVSNYLKCGADPNIAIHLAAQYGYSGIVELLLDRGADVDLHRNNDTWTPLHVAVQHEHLNVVRLLLNKGAKTYLRKNNKCTPLYQASTLGNVLIVQELLASGASTESRCENDSTPLHVAATKNYVNIASVLIEHGADVNAQNMHAQTALHLAAKYGNEEIVKLLIQHKANVNLRNKDAKTALHVAIQFNQTQTAKVLLEHGADANMLGGPYWQTPLYMATFRGNLEMVKLLIQHEVNVNLRNKDAQTALHGASQFNQSQIAKFLLEHGAGVHMLGGPLWQTPLYMATLKGNLEIVKLLIQHKVNVNLRNKDAQTALHGASQFNQSQIAKVLLEHGADANMLGGLFWQTPLYMATSKGNLQIVKLLIQHKANVNLKNKDAQTALHSASQFNQTQIAKVLLEHGADANMLGGLLWQTPLYMATSKGNLEIVKLLIKHKANVNLQNQDGKTALQAASHFNQPQIDKVLRDAGAV